MSIIRGQEELFNIYQGYQYIFFPDLLVSFLFENKGHGFTIAFLCRRMGWLIATGIFLREGIE